VGIDFFIKFVQSLDRLYCKVYFIEEIMKKYALLLCCAVILSAGVAGLDFSLSAGAGGLPGYTFTRYTLEDRGTMPGSSTTGDLLSQQSMDRFNYGGFLFFDATYGELAILIQGGTNSYGETMDFKLQDGSWVNLADGKGTGTEISLGFSLLGKYPFRITERISLFPLLGIEYQIALLEWRKPDGDKVYDRTKGELPEDRDKDGNSYPLSVWNSFWIDIGAGFDYMITGPLYLRSEILFGFRLATRYENGALEMTKHQFNAPDPKLTGLTGSPTLKIAVGYRFFNL
jgi:hypothetical protein